VVLVSVIEPPDRLGWRRDQILNNNQARRVSSNRPSVTHPTFEPPTVVQYSLRIRATVREHGVGSTSGPPRDPQPRRGREEPRRSAAQAVVHFTWCVEPEALEETQLTHRVDGGLSLARISSAQDVDLAQRQISPATFLGFGTPSDELMVDPLSRGAAAAVHLETLVASLHQL
jgi:hypothetical protein